jgi:hypothetical protein
MIFILGWAEGHQAVKISEPFILNLPMRKMLQRDSFKKINKRAIYDKIEKHLLKGGPERSPKEAKVQKEPLKKGKDDDDDDKPLADGNAGKAGQVGKEDDDDKEENSSIKTNGNSNKKEEDDDDDKTEAEIKTETETAKTANGKNKVEEDDDDDDDTKKASNDFFGWNTIIYIYI